jgi:hypothetical protein
MTPEGQQIYADFVGLLTAFDKVRTSGRCISVF